MGLVFAKFPEPSSGLGFRVQGISVWGLGNHVPMIFGHQTVPDALT